MTRCLAIVALLIGFVGSGTARGACVPFGGDDAGCIPPDSASFKYEAKVGKNLNKYQKCVIKCHQSTASGKITPGTNEDNCEADCKTKYDTANTKLTVPPPATCLVTDSVRQFWKGFLDLNNGAIFCDPGTPFGGDDTGNIPADSTILKCETKVASNVAKLLKCSGKCHAKRAKGSLADDTEENACEDACRTKFDNSNAKLTPCPGCLNTISLGNNIRANSDGNNGSIYCAQ
jgi:hypothetical protein